MTTENRPDSERDEVTETTESVAESAAPGAEGRPPEAPEDPAAAAAARAAEAESRAAAAESRAAEAHDRYLRAQAELENVRKRTARELAERTRYANEELLREILPAFDNLDRALEATAGEEGPAAVLREGVELTRNQLLAALRKHGVAPVEALGRPFDPALHEAVQQVPSDEPSGTVVAEYRRGYLLNGRLVRPAMVGVAAPQPGPGRDGASPADDAEA